MKKIVKRQIRVIEANTGTEFEQKYNDALNELTAKEIRCEKPLIDLAALRAIVEFEETLMVAETLEEEYKLRDEYFICGHDCPLYEKTGSGIGTCIYTSRGDRYNDDLCCKNWWRMFESGELEKLKKMTAKQLQKWKNDND